MASFYSTTWRESKDLGEIQYPLNKNHVTCIKEGKVEENYIIIDIKDSPAVASYRTGTES